MSDVSQYPEYKKIMYPPRPKLSIPNNKIKDYEDKGYVGQLKFNGTRTMIEIAPGGKISLWTRRKELHKAYVLSKQLEADILSIYEGLDQTKTTILDGELMHSKTKNLKNTMILFDILVCNSDYFVGMSMLDRYRILDDICGNPNEHESKTGRKLAARCRVFEGDTYRYLDNLWMAECFFFNLEHLYNSRIDMDEIEGVVLKKPDAPLGWGISQNNNDNWLIRCRKPNKNYNF